MNTLDYLQLMKYSLFFTLILATVLVACTVESQEDPLDVYRNVAYSALNATQKSSILGDWKKAEVGAWTNGNYVVSFPLKDGTVIRVIVDPDTGRVIEILT